MREHTVNSMNNFLMGWYLEDTTICDRIIDFHKINPKKDMGTVYDKATRVVDHNRKLSIDSALNDNFILLKEYVDEVLKPSLSSYMQKYKFCQEYGKFLNKEITNVQHYPPNGGFFQWHCERGSADLPAVTRHLVYMTYLNDVHVNGETEFYYQQVKVKPEKGLTLIWPVDWTFTHRGVASKTQTKYITTGWFNFVEQV